MEEEQKDEVFLNNSMFFSIIDPWGSMYHAIGSLLRKYWLPMHRVHFMNCGNGFIVAPPKTHSVRLKYQGWNDIYNVG